jgi:hypothetical protein
MISNEKLDFWIEHHFNVLLTSEKGVGKSSIILETFKRHGLRYLYFSAPTLDVFTDLIGIPKEVKSPEGSFIDYVKPKHIAYDEIDAIFIDEIGRGGKRVNNCIFELLQFKSLNGHKLNNLKVVWAATNPESRDDEGNMDYDVERLDPALKDRFHVIINLPYVLNKSYFIQKYGENISDSVVEWWNSLTEKIQKNVSPRRMDYALEYHGLGGDLRDVLPSEGCNISALALVLSNGSYTKKLIDLINNKKIPQLKQFLADEQNYSFCIETILKNDNYLEICLPLLSEEKIISMLKNEKVSDFVVNYRNSFVDVIEAIKKSKSSAAHMKAIKKILESSSANTGHFIAKKISLDDLN